MTQPSKNTGATLTADTQALIAANMAKINEFQAVREKVAGLTTEQAKAIAAETVKQINHNIASLKTYFIGPLHPVLDNLGISLITGSPLLVLGEAGTAKSAVVRAWGHTIDGSSVYKLLSPSSTPDQVFGAIDLGELKRSGTLVRMHANRIPSSNFVVLDEFFRASEYLWNSLFMLLNEKKYEGIDGSEYDLPMLQVVALANDLPPLSKNGAILDRFVSTIHLETASNDEKKKILENSDKIEYADFLEGLQPVSIEGVLATRSLLRNVKISHATLHKIGQALAGDGVKVSPRRLNYAKNMARASAVLDGRFEVEASDFIRTLYSLCVTRGDQEVAKKAVLRNVDGAQADSNQITAKLHNRIAGVERDAPNAVQLYGTAVREALVELKELEAKTGKEFPAVRNSIKQFAAALSADISGLDDSEPDTAEPKKKGKK